MDTLKLQIKQLLIEAFDLEHLTPEDIGDDTPLFGTNGVGLDSIDALEIGLVLRERYKLTIAADDEHVRDYFRSVNTLAALVAGQRKEVAVLDETTGKGD
jgi:acyl carrier protein